MNNAMRKSDYPRDHWLRIRHRPNLAVTHRQRSTYLFVSAEIEERKTKNEDTGVETVTHHIVNQKTARTFKLESDGAPIKIGPREAFIDLTKSRRT